jgi:hypothetical protein
MAPSIGSNMKRYPSLNPNAKHIKAFHLSNQLILQGLYISGQLVSPI